MIDLLHEILQTLRNNKLRTALTGLAVAWGIFMLITLLGVANGVYSSFEDAADIESFSTVTVWNGYTSKPWKGYKEGRAVRLEHDDIDYLTKQPSQHIKKSVALAGIDTVKVQTTRDYLTDGLLGVYPEYGKIQNCKIVSGRFIDQADIDNKRKVVVMAQNNARLLFGGDGTQAVGKRVDAAGLSWLVVGIYDSEWRRDTYIPLTVALAIKGNSPYVNQIMVMGKDMATLGDAEAFETEVRNLLAEKHVFDPTDKSGLYIWNRFENYLQASTGMSMMQTVIWVIGILTLLSGIIGVSNIMFVSVKERTHEIGVRRAIGAKPRSVMTQIVTESIAITTIFGYIGVFLGIVACELLEKFYGDTEFIENPHVDISIAIKVTIVLIIAGAVAGFFPAIKATKVKPVEALRDE